MFLVGALGHGDGLVSGPAAPSPNTYSYRCPGRRRHSSRPPGALRRVTLAGAGCCGPSLSWCSTTTHTQYTTSVICPRISAAPRQWLLSLRNMLLVRVGHPHLVPWRKGLPPLSSPPQAGVEHHGLRAKG